MPINVQDLGLARELVGFVAKETTFGTLPDFASANAIGLLGTPKAEQNATFSDSKEVVNSRSLPSRFRDKMGAGAWSLNTYCRPSGVAGSAPVEAVLLECAAGTKSVSAGVSVSFTPALTLPSFSLGFKTGHLTKFLVGCMVEEAKLGIQAKGGLEWSWSGGYQRELIAGTAQTASGSTTTVINLETGAAKRFDVGARVQVGSDTNTAAGYTISDKDEDADTITITPAIGTAPAADVTVKGYLPTASLAGSPLAGRLAALKKDGIALHIKDSSLSVKNKIQFLTDEVSDEDYPPGALADQRTVEGQGKLFLLKQYVELFTQARDQTRSVIQVVVGKTAGSILTINLPLAEFNSPTPSADSAVLILDTSFQGMPSSALEDEFSIVYT